MGEVEGKRMLERWGEVRDEERRVEVRVKKKRGVEVRGLEMGGGGGGGGGEGRRRKIVVGGRVEKGRVKEGEVVRVRYR